jgi:hypothetical protein
MMLGKTVDHLIANILPAAADYAAAEDVLTQVYRNDPAPAAWEAAARMAKRRAAEAAIAVDGLTDRFKIALGDTKADIRSRIASFCFWPNSDAPRPGAHERIRGVANAYKHQNLSDLTLPILSTDDVLVVGSGWNVDAWGVGKYGGLPEVLVSETAGGLFKFLGDVPVAIAAWFHFLAAQGAALPPGPVHCCNLEVHQ